MIYWDWTNPKETELILTTHRLGASVNGSVIGDLFSKGWKVICFDTTETCDPEQNNTTLTRCLNETTCSPDYNGWPTKDDVAKALEIESYSEFPYDKSVMNSFSNRLEGFIPHTDGTIGRGLHNIVSVVNISDIIATYIMFTLAALIDTINVTQYRCMH